MTPGEQIHELRTRATALRKDAERLDAQAITVMATEHARVERELRRELAAITRPVNCVDHRGQGCGWCHIAGAST